MSSAWIVLILSPTITMMSNIFANVSAMDISKGRQLSLKSKLVLTLYLLSLLSSQLFRMIPTVLASLSHNPAISPETAALLLLVPILVHWAFLLFVMSSRIKSFPDTVIHLASNMWLVTPARVNEGRNEVHKSREQALYLLALGLNMVATITLTAFMMNGTAILTSLPFPSAAVEYLVIGGAPAISCHLLSCALLVFYYRCCHNWRGIGGHRDVTCCCCTPIGRLCSKEKPIPGEIPFWEQVS